MIEPAEKVHENVLLPYLAGDTLKLSPLLLNCQRKVTSPGSAWTAQRTLSSSSNAAPIT